MSCITELSTTCSALTIAEWKERHNYHALRFSKEIQQAIYAHGPKARPFRSDYLAWLTLWNYDSIKTILRPLYNNDERQFRSAYWKLSDVDVKHQDEAFQDFVRFDKKTTKESHRRGGHKASRALVRDLDKEQPSLSTASNCLLVGIDCEFDEQNQVSEFGMAVLDTRDIFPTGIAKYGEGGIKTDHWVLHKRNHLRPRLFCRRVRTSKALLPDQIRECLPLDRKVIIVGHSVRCDLRGLRDLGMLTEDIPGFAGIVDTARLAEKVLDHTYKLNGLLTRLRIPHRYLHNPANDAHFALQALLGLLYEQHRHTAGLGSSRHPLFRLDEIARAPLPVPAFEGDDDNEQWSTSEGWTFLEEEYVEGLDTLEHAWGVL